jgi:hypothetical protein
MKLFDKAKAVAEDLVEKAGPLAKKAKPLTEKAAPYAEKAGDLAAKGVSTAAENLNRATHGKYQSTIDNVSNKLGDALSHDDKPNPGGAESGETSTS